MALRLNDEFVPPPEDGDAEIKRLKELLQKGGEAEKAQAVARLIAVKAESALTECLAAENPITVQLATGALWECWMSEEGPIARRKMEEGIKCMDAGELEEALNIFVELADQYPHWAEALNKQATVLYLIGDARGSLKLCRKVVEMKPNHFGAWNGMALCAAHLERWQVALDAAKQALRLQPTAQANLDLIQLAEARLREEA